MAKKTNGKSKEVKETSPYFSLSGEKKKKILGIFLLIFSLILLLSIVSYSRFDRALLSYRMNDFFRTFSSDELQRELHTAQNWLGIVGAYLAEFSINTTLGIFSLIFPFVFGLWGFSFFKKIEFKTLLNISNFLIVSGLLLSTMFGVVRLEYNLFYQTYELSGAFGNFLGRALGTLIGGVGSLLLLSSLMLITLIIAFDIKIEKIFVWIASLFARTKDDAEEKVSEAKTSGKEKDNLEKIKELREKKRKTVLPVGDIKANELTSDLTDEQKEETTIRIIRKDEPSPTKTEIDKKGKKEKNTDEEENESKLKSKPDDDVMFANRDIEAALPDPWEEKIKYHMPSLDLLNEIPKQNFKVAEEELKKNAELLKDKLSLFDIEIQDISVTPGPVVTLYEIVPAPGVKISKIVSLEHDIALALAARGIRIIAPIPGKSAIGVEIPNSEPSLVVAKSVLSKLANSKAELPLALGEDIAGEVLISDLAKMPHLLIAGSTGSGKSVGINMIIASLLYAKHPSEVKLAIIDPKKIELSFYNCLRKHYLAVSPDFDEDIVTVPTNAVLLLKSVEYEMEKRYDKLAKAGVRNIVDYNIKIADPKKAPKDTETMKHYHLPYIVVIIDELADLMITAGKEVEEPIARLAQLARAVGIHLVLATQRPSVNVITGVIKANFSARMAYQVASKIDSRTILDMNGAEQLLGRGDMLFLPPGLPKPIRMQNAFITTEEVERLTEYISKQDGYSKPYNLPSLYDKKKDAAANFMDDVDPLFHDAARVVVRHQQGSVSLLQRRLKLGYSRAARIVDQLEEAGIVGPNDGSKAREVIVENEEQLETILRNI
ncbi:MAG: DNA translocase FtsK 4TM domain-containing protein [Ignavibacteria bacterium]|nr:DNA translocase FtsK 4TM domain-containing protein [Ignavibacteria bacterium]